MGAWNRIADKIMKLNGRKTLSPLLISTKFLWEFLSATTTVLTAAPWRDAHRSTSDRLVPEFQTEVLSESYLSIFLTGCVRCKVPFATPVVWEDLSMRKLQVVNGNYRRSTHVICQYCNSSCILLYVMKCIGHLYNLQSDCLRVPIVHSLLSSRTVVGSNNRSSRGTGVRACEEFDLYARHIMSPQTRCVVAN